MHFIVIFNLQKNKYYAFNPNNSSFYRFLYYICPLTNLNLSIPNMDNLTYKYINLQSLKENTGGIIDIEIELMHLFNDIVEEFINTLERELPNKNWQKLYDAVHKIKPNIHMFGISSMEVIISELENNFRNEENLENIDDTVKDVVRSFKEIKKEIKLELHSLTK